MQTKSPSQVGNDIATALVIGQVLAAALRGARDPRAAVQNLLGDLEERIGDAIAKAATSFPDEEYRERVEQAARSTVLSIGTVAISYLDANRWPDVIA